MMTRSVLNLDRLSARDTIAAFFAMVVISVFGAGTCSALASTAEPMPPEFAQCAGCHRTGNGGGVGLGPNLRGVYGRKAATQRGFPYSAAMKKSGVRWTSAELDKFLAAPRRSLPGTSMSFSGVQNEAKRARIIAYLATLK